MLMLERGRGDTTESVPDAPITDVDIDSPPEARSRLVGDAPEDDPGS